MGGWQLTTLLDAPDGRVADGFVHRVDRLLDRGAGVLVRERTRGEAEWRGDRGARSSQSDGSEEGHG